ncbi:hypothetical protein VTO73DRAFT_14534 [Trametes versicolor]
MSGARRRSRHPASAYVDCAEPMQLAGRRESRLVHKDMPRVKGRHGVRRAACPAYAAGGPVRVHVATQADIRQYHPKHARVRSLCEEKYSELRMRKGRSITVGCGREPSRLIVCLLEITSLYTNAPQTQGIHLSTSEPRAACCATPLSSPQRPTHAPYS